MPIDFKHSGRMLTGSKGNYLAKHPDHVAVFNANLCVKSKGKIWYGDVDLTLDAKDLKRFAAEQGEDIYVLRELDARFEYERNPKYESAVAIIKTDGNIEILKK